MVVHTYNPNTWEAKAGGSLNTRPAWATERPASKKKKRGEGEDSGLGIPFT